MILIASLVALATLDLILYFRSEKDAPYAVDEGLYSVANQTSIDEVQLITPSSHITLRYDGARWRVNEQYDADMRMISVLFATLQEARPKRLASGHQIDSLRQAIYSRGTRVSLLAHGHPLKTFYAGGSAEKTRAYFQDSVNGPHLVNIPGYRVYTTGIFELSEPGWRSKRIFGFNWRNLKSVSVSFKGGSNQGFEVENTGNLFAVAGLARTDTAKLNDYLDKLSLLIADEWVDPTVDPERAAYYDSALQGASATQALVNDVGGATYSLTLYNARVDGKAIGKTTDGQIALFDRRKVIFLQRVRSDFALRQVGKK